MSTPEAIIDAHHHIWRVADVPWLSGPILPRIFGDYTALRQDYSAEQLIGEIAPHGVTKWSGIAAVASELGIAPEEICAVGDDVNDEVVFERAPLHWLTLRVGREPASQARFFLDSQSEVAQLLEQLLAQLPERR